MKLPDFRLRHITRLCGRVNVVKFASGIDGVTFRCLNLQPNGVLLRVSQHCIAVPRQAEQVTADDGCVGGTVTGAMDEVERLIEAIARSGVKRSWLADEAGISKSTLSRIE